MQRKPDLGKMLEVVVSVGALCTIIIFFTVVARVMVDVIENIWSRSAW